MLIVVVAEPLRAAGYVPLQFLRTSPSSSRHYIKIVNFPLHSLTNTSRRLGNDAPEDEQPTKAPRQVVKNTSTTKKQDEKPAATGASRGKQGARRGYSGNEGGEQPQFSLCLHLLSDRIIAFRDHEAGRDSNRSKVTDAEGSQTRGAGRGRGGRRGRDFDRHSRTGVAYDTSIPQMKSPQIRALTV
jgi:hypothetical protein